MKLWKFIVLAVIAGALAFYVFQVERPAQVAKSRVEQPLMDVPKNSFRVLTIGRKGETPFTLRNAKSGTEKETSGETWEVLGIVGSKLDSATLNGTLSELEKFKIQDALPQSELEGDLAVYGLSEPELTVAATYDATTEPFEVRFGKRSDFLTKRYVSVKQGGQQAIYLTDEALYNTANKELIEYRNKNPFTVAEQDIQKVSLSQGGNKTVVEKISATDQGSKWQIKEPIKVQASEKSVKDLLTAIRFLRAERYIDGDARKEIEPLFETPLATLITTSTAGETTVTLATRLVGTDGQPENYVRVSGLESIAKITGDPAKQVVKGLSELREKRYFSFPMEQVTKISASKGSENFVITRVGEAWKVGDKTGDFAFIAQYLKTLSEVEAVDYPSDKESASFDAPTARIAVTLEKDGGTKDLVLVVGAPRAENASQYFATVEPIKEPFFISADVLPKIFPATEELIEVMPMPAVASPEGASAP